MTSSVRGRARRRWLFGVVGFLSIVACAIAALPWLLTLPAVQRRIAVEANKIMAPGSVEFSAIRLSWLQPTEITNVVLHDAHGNNLVAAPRATFGWSLWQIVATRPQTATLTIQKADLDIERSADGTINLYETLRPVISEHPAIRLKIRIENGRLRYRDTVFTDPVIAEQARVILDLGRNSEPITWDIQLTHTHENAEAARLDIKGNYSRAQADPAGRHDLGLELKGTRWPWTLANSLVQGRGELTGTLGGEMLAGHIRIAGDATITNLIAIGDLLTSDTVHVESARVRLGLTGYQHAWSIEKLELTSPLASLTGEGSIPPTPDKGAWLEATVDLAGVARQLPTTLHLHDDLRVERGSARLRADSKLRPDGHTEGWSVSGKVSEVSARLGPKVLVLPEPATLAAKLQRDKATTKLERLDVQSSFLTASGHGDLDQGIVLEATLDLAAFRDRFRDWINLGRFELSGVGELGGLYKRQGQKYQASLNASFRDLRIAGLPLVEKLARDRATFEGKIGGRSTASGWPLSWNALSVHALSGEAELTMSAQAGPAPGDLAVTGRAKAPLPSSGRPQRFEGEIKATSSHGAWTTDQLTLAVLRASKWGAGIGPEEAIRWEGRGHYDPRGDELKIESIAKPQRVSVENETWITGNQNVRAGSLKSLSAVQIEATANGDLKPLGLWLSPGNSPLSGQYDALVRIRPDRERWDLSTRLDLRGLEGTFGDTPASDLAGNILLTMNALYTPRSDQLDLTEMTVKAPNLQLDGAGTVSRLTSKAEVDLKGSLDLDWKAIGALLARKVEPNARITGRPREWRIAGTIDGLPAFNRMGSLEGDIGVQIDSLDLFGMRLSDVPVVLRAAGGQLTVDAIEGKLNDGIVHIEPELVRRKDGSTWMHLGSESRLDGAVVNDEVSHRVLSFAAPVLDGATRVDGRVSFALAEAYLPILAPAGAQASLRGDVFFDDVRFMPGPMADQLLSVFQRERKPLAVLRDPIAIRVAGRKVYQQGLTVPVGNLASIGVDGSVDFDQNLDLVARFALVPPRSSVPVLSPLMANARFDLPIRGTLKNPKIDGDALKDHWKAIGTGMLGDSMEAGLNGLQRLIQGIPVPGLRGLVPPARRIAPPPRPAGPDDNLGPIENDGGPAPTQRQALKPPARSVERAAPLTRGERLRRKELRRQERLQKKADRQTKPLSP